TNFQLLGRYSEVIQKQLTISPMVSQSRNVEAEPKYMMQDASTIMDGPANNLIAIVQHQETQTMTEFQLSEAIEANQEQFSESSYKVIHGDGSAESKNHEIYQCISESNQMHGNSTDGIKQLIILNAELETNVEVLKGEIWTLNEQLKKLLVDRDLSKKPCEFSQRGEVKFESTLEQKCSLEEQKDTTKKRQRQAALPENESNHRLLEWQEKGKEMENSSAAVRLKPKSTDKDPLFRDNAELVLTNQRLQIKVDELREQMAKHISSFHNTDILVTNQQPVFEQQFWDEFIQEGKLVEN
ncbi:unnamed protein product, partial [Onchocerca ochengi]|uniref:TEX9 protein n=1 Tax=Onchocerca ochengi TaxID=42157 RepID=A0A182EWY6_ONCOC